MKNPDWLQALAAWLLLILVIVAIFAFMWSIDSIVELARAAGCRMDWSELRYTCPEVVR